MASRSDGRPRLLCSHRRRCLTDCQELSSASRPSARVVTSEVLAIVVLCPPPSLRLCLASASPSLRVRTPRLHRIGTAARRSATGSGRPLSQPTAARRRIAAAGAQPQRRHNHAAVRTRGAHECTVTVGSRTLALAESQKANNPPEIGDFFATSKACTGTRNNTISLATRRTIFYHFIVLTPSS